MQRSDLQVYLCVGAVYSAGGAKMSEKRNDFSQPPERSSKGHGEAQGGEGLRTRKLG